MYSDLVKNRAIIHYKYFLRSLRKVSKIYNISKSTLGRWLRRDGNVKPRKRKTSIVETISSFIDSKLLEDPFLTTSELSKAIKDSLNLKTSSTSCWRSLRYANFTRKKTRNTIITLNKPTQVQEFKDSYKRSKNLISLDETFFYYDIPRYGYSKRGQQLRKQLTENPKKHKLTLYMAISDSKIVGYKISKTHGNTDNFLEFLKSMDIRDSTLLMDNVAFHKSKLVKEYVESMKSSILYVPPYSPEFNPIELAFSKIKTVYRKLCLDSNTDRVQKVETSINSLSVENLNNFFKYVLEKIEEKFES